MAKTDYKTIDDYLADLSDENRTGVRAICDAITRAVPDAEGVISYQIPAFRYHGWIFYVSAHKDHYSLSCPPPIAAFEAFKDELARYAKSKSALKLPKKEPLPITLIEQMAACHAQHNVEQADKKG
jgi:uncharacterized protein YdhG (YjbR/CyaY superfamily)